jgi:hypothetical protein
MLKVDALSCARTAPRRGRFSFWAKLHLGPSFIELFGEYLARGSSEHEPPLSIAREPNGVVKIGRARAQQAKAEQCHW